MAKKMEFEETETRPKKGAKKATGQVNNYDEELAQFAREQQEMEQNSGGGLPMISCRGGEFSFGGNVIGETINVVILNHIKENCYYADDYDSENPVPPTCFAFGTKEAEMAPHENVTDKQCSLCGKCKLNEFGSADRGKGKACKNVRRLQLILEDDMEDIEAAEIKYLKVSVMSVKGFSTFIQQVTSVMKLPSFGVLAEISIHPDKKAQYKLSFKVLEKIDDKEVLHALLDIRKARVDELVTPYAPAAEEDEEEEEERPKGKKKKKDEERSSGRKGRKF